jgi:segregation and condensation protein A
VPLQPIPVEGGPEDGFEVHLDVFSGPLGLLLHLIESQQLDILSVPLADLADAYVGHLAANPVVVEELADFVGVAAQLILLKSRRMLPGEVVTAAADQPDEPDEAELRRRLIEYRALRDAARELGDRDGAWPAYRREPRESDLPEIGAPVLPARLLAEALAVLAAIPEPEPEPPEVVPREVTIGMQIAALQAAMRGVGQVVLQQVLGACRSRTQVTVTLLAALELVRRRQVRMVQDELFGPIVLHAATDGGAG